MMNEISSSFCRAEKCYSFVAVVVKINRKIGFGPSFEIEAVCPALRASPTRLYAIHEPRYLDGGNFSKRCIYDTAMTTESHFKYKCESLLPLQAQTP